MNDYFYEFTRKYLHALALKLDREIMNMGNEIKFNYITKYLIDEYLNECNKSII